MEWRTLALRHSSRVRIIHYEWRNVALCKTRWGKKSNYKKNDCGVPFFPNTPKKKNKLVEGFFCGWKAYCSVGSRQLAISMEGSQALVVGRSHKGIRQEQHRKRWSIIVSEEVWHKGHVSKGIMFFLWRRAWTPAAIGKYWSWLECLISRSRKIATWLDEEEDHGIITKWLFW